LPQKFSGPGKERREGSLLPNGKRKSSKNEGGSGLETDSFSFVEARGW